ncbi:PREDICTED: titin-like, partial [Rhagoletis zephyria]|uniref:titin-like n=1 Tax=Rhagoletis zephyria TaxID=28612 RepID=UPI0008114374
MPLTTDAAARPDEQPKKDVVTTEVVPDLEKDEEITIEEITVDGDKKKVIKRTKKPKQPKGEDVELPLTTDAAARPDEQPKEEIVTIEDVPDFNNNQFEYITPDQYEVTQQLFTHQQVQVNIVLENELTIIEPLVYENVKEFVPKVNFTSANLVVQTGVEKSADIGENICYGQTKEVDFKIMFEKPNVHIETNDCIDIVDNSVVFNSIEKFVKEVTEYSIINEQPLTKFESGIKVVEIQPKENEIIVVTEYVPVESSEDIDLKVVEPEVVVTDDVEQDIVQYDVDKQKVADENQTDEVLLTKEKIDEIKNDKDECQIEDVSNEDIHEEFGEITEPIISLFRDEKIIKINIENDEIQITEFKSDNEELFEEEKDLRMQVDTSEIEEEKETQRLSEILGSEIECTNQIKVVKTAPESVTPLEIETVKKVKKIKRKESKPELIIPETKEVEEQVDVQVSVETQEVVSGEIDLNKPTEVSPEEVDKAPESVTPLEIKTVTKVKKIKRKESKPEFIIPETKEVEEQVDVQVSVETQEVVSGEIDLNKPTEVSPEEVDKAPESVTPLEIKTVTKVKKIKRKESKPELITPETKEVEDQVDVQISIETQEV